MPECRVGVSTCQPPKLYTTPSHLWANQYAIHSYLKHSRTKILLTYCRAQPAKSRAHRPRWFPQHRGWFLSARGSFIEGKGGFSHSREFGGCRGQIWASLYSFDSKFWTECNGEILFLIWVSIFELIAIKEFWRLIKRSRWKLRTWKGSQEVWWTPLSNSFYVDMLDYVSICFCVYVICNIFDPLH